MMSAFFLITATCLDRMAVGTKRRLMARICSPKPGMTLSATASVASGVTSRGAGPVPPVVRTRWQPFSSTSSFNVDSITACSSAMSRVSSRQAGAAIAEASQALSAGTPSSLYTPAEARSLTETRPTMSPSFISLCRKFLEKAKHLPVRARRLAFLHFLARVPQQRAQRLQVGAREGGGEFGQRLVVGAQPLTPGLDRPGLGGRLGRGALEGGGPRADRRGGHRAHQPAYVLQLAALRLMALDAPCREHGLVEPAVQRQLGELRLRQLDQGRAARLQLVRFLLSFRLADDFILHRAVS